MMTAALVSIISRVMTSQHFSLYNSITFISISIASIPVPATHIPTINISNIQYTIPAIKGFGIFVLICATDCPTSIVQPIKVCMNDAASWKNDLQSERNTSDCTAGKRVVVSEYHARRNKVVWNITVFALYCPASRSFCVSYFAFAF